MEGSAGSCEFLRRYAGQIAGQLGCWDRLVLTGTLVDVGYSGALESRLRQDQIRCFDLKHFAEPLREGVREHAIKLARAAGLEVEFIPRKNFRKEDRITKLLARRGTQPGLVHVFSAMEPCTTFQPWHDKKSGRTGLKPTSGKCLHFYFYFIHERWGLCYLRVPTWLPFRLQFYCNGHAWLAGELKKAGIDFAMEDNAFVRVADWNKAQQLSDGFDLKMWHADLNALAKTYLPFLDRFPNGYHWNLMQVEYSWDLVWKKAEDLAPVYGEISRQAILAVKAADVARFLGKRLSAEAEVTSDFGTRVEGTRIKHKLGPASVKMYDKRGRVLRIEITANDVTYFRHYRKVVGRDGSSEYKVAALKKSIYSLGDLKGLMQAATVRYLAFIATLEDRSSGQVNLERITGAVKDSRERSWRGFNFFCRSDANVLLAIVRGEYQISGLSNRLLQRVLPEKNAGQIGRILKRLRLHGLLKKVGRTYKYYITALGQKTLIAALKIKEHLLVPVLANAPAPA